MHEFSIAQALVQLVAEHAPRGSTLRSVKVRAGPMRAIEPTAMQWAWRAATQGTDYDGAYLDLELPPWVLLCPDCGRQYTSAQLYEPCQCGSDRSRPVGGDELQLVSLQVDLPDAPLDAPSIPQSAGER